MPSDNSYTVNLTSCGVDNGNNDRSNYLAGNMFGGLAKICTIVSEPFGSITKSNYSPIHTMIAVEYDNQTYVVLFAERNVIEQL